MSPVGPLPETFTTARLHAERLLADHEAVVHHMHRDAALMTHLGGLRDAAFSHIYMERNLSHWEQFGFGAYMLREIGGTDYIGRGLVRHFPVDGVDEVEVGYAFYPAFWGKGYATEIARACVDLAYGVLAVDTVVAITLPANTASQHVLEKCGLAYERSVEHDAGVWSLYRGRK